ncbi:hypothetical protein E2562_004984 [Oryza meyeriana var. granulata]|uniref:Reverse transcriptase zinc-binding domain-containing protein n=1 Tax=Oryza meyeriana var. granulata TaxID=110450 RepID=A0A6G1C4V2_9ORYZ|nr:hypothetical protein E2562_004984 [Oryza meyeriana var. granulata]
MSERLEARGWPNNRDWPLCHQSIETTFHLMADCRYTRRIWQTLSVWTSCDQLMPDAWTPTTSVQEWWTMLATGKGLPKKGVRTLILLTAWEI